MTRVEFVDTSILLNMLNVPGKNQDREAVLDELAPKQAAGTLFVLPVTSVIETGNHIAQLPDGNQGASARRRSSRSLAWSHPARSHGCCIGSRGTSHSLTG